jgi:putative salt-induced outer membrane protein YdiY
MARFGLVVCAIAALASVLRADEIIFTNGDKLTGEIISADGGKLKIKTESAGEVTVDMEKVSTFSTDKPLSIRMKDNTMVEKPVNKATTQPATTQPAAVIVAGGKEIAVADIKQINIKQKWTGSVSANLNLARGNTHSLNVGVAVDAALRRDDGHYDDRFSVAGAYNFGRSTDNDGVQTTSEDNWFAMGKYDKYFNEKLYGYGLVRYERDRIAFLDYRVAPGVGVGYQWFESPDFNLSTEIGLSYVYEAYTTGGDDDKIALRLAYHVDKKLSEDISVFHNLEFLPAIDDWSDFNLNADAGIRANLTENMFSEAKVIYQHDSTPAPEAEKNDVRLIVGVGWAF